MGDLRQLFNGLTARLKSPSFDLNFPWAQIHEVLRRRSPYRVTVGWQAITTSNEDDELVYSFNPILRDLNAALAAKRRDLGSLFGLDTKRYMWGRNIDELSAAFAGFKTAVESVSRAIKASTFTDEPCLFSCSCHEFTYRDGNVIPILGGATTRSRTRLVAPGWSQASDAALAGAIALAR